VRLIAFADLDIDRATNGFANEYGAFVSLASPPGAPIGAVAANAWEIDEPGFLYGNIVTNALAGTLDNFNAVPSGAPDDVSMALQFPIGDVKPTQSFSVQLQLSTTNIGGLRQTDPTSSRTVYLNGFSGPLVGTGPDVPLIPVTPSPSSLLLLVVGLAAVSLFHRQLRGAR